MKDQLSEDAAGFLLGVTDELRNDVNDLTASLGGLKFTVTTQAAYNALTAKDSNTIYLITG